MTRTILANAKLILPDDTTIGALVIEDGAIAEILPGTSGQVYPAAGLAQHARRKGAETVELNLAASAVSSDFTDHRTGPATEVVPAWVAELCR